MDKKNKNFTRNIMLLLLLPGLGFIMLLILFYVYVEETKDDTSFVNIAGRQRMLSQQMSSLSHMIADGQNEDGIFLLDAVRDFEIGLLILGQSDMVKKYHSIYDNSDEVEVKLNEVSELWSSLKPLLLLVAENPSYDDNFRDAILAIKAGTKILTEVSDEVVIAYDSRTDKLRELMFIILMFAVIVGVVSIIVTLFIVYRFTKDRQAVERQLVKSQERFSLAVSGSNDGIWDWDLESGKIFFSGRWKEMLSYEPDEIDNKFSSWQQLIHPDDLGLFLDLWVNYMEGRTNQLYIEYRLKTKIGNYKWIMCRGTSNPNAFKHTRLSGSHTDISRRKEYEDQLENEKIEQAILINKLQDAQDDLSQNEEVLRLSQVFSEVGNWMRDLDSDEFSCSEYIYILFDIAQCSHGATFENILNAIHPDDRNDVTIAMHNCINNNDNYDIEHRVIWSDSSLHWLRQRGNVIRSGSGKALRMLATVQDVTDQKEFESDLQKLIDEANRLNSKLVDEHRERLVSEEKLANILDIAPEAIIVIDGSHNISVFNKGAEIIFGHTAAQVIGQPLDMLIPESCVARHPGYVDSFINSPVTVSKMSQRSEIRGKRSDGSEFPCAANISKIKQHDEWVCTVILRDLTEQKKAEQALLQEKHEQEQLISKLQDAQDQLLQSEKMASIGQLAAGVAHEINNPVGYINSNIGSLKNYLDDLLLLLESYEVIEDKISDSDALESILKIKKDVDLNYLKNDIRDLISESEEGIKRVKQIVQDLKDFSHVDEAEWQWADLHKGINSTLNIVHNELKYNADVIKEYADLPQVECIISQLNQVFMNLLVNAAHAIENHGTITVRTGTENDGVWVEVEDTGKGMDEATRKRIFDPFFTTKPVGKGTGLGLSLSFSIIQKHGGSIVVNSEPGKGTCFHIWLPVHQDEHKA